MPALAEGSAAPEKVARFEQRVVAILNAGGTPETIQGRLGRVGSEQALSHDQQLALEAIQTLVRSKSRPQGLSLADAESFAARNPASAASKMLVAEAALANDQPQRSADLLIEAAAKGGDLVQLVSPATVSKLTRELDDLADKRRSTELAKALTTAGWNRGSANLRSYLALLAIRDLLAGSQVSEARRLLPAIRSPASLYMILIDNRLAALRPDVEAMAGPRLEQAWRDLLTSTRDQWLERGDVLTALAYSEALKQANQYEALSAAFLTRFTRGYNCPRDLVARSIGDDLADSLARIGRWTKAEDVLRRSGGVPAPVYAAMLLERGEFGRASSLLDRSLKAADAPTDTDEAKAFAWLRAAAACAASRSGRGVGATPAELSLLDVSARLFVLLCLNRAEEARANLIAALDDEEDRAEALRWVQPFNDPPLQSDFRKRMNERVRALQGDPAVVAKVAEHGVIVDWPLTAAVPAPDALPPAKTAAPWRCGDQPAWEVGPPTPDLVALPYQQR